MVMTLSITFILLFHENRGAKKGWGILSGEKSVEIK